MWTVAELKKRSKSVLSHTYWNGVLAYLIQYGISMGITMIAYVIAFIGIIVSAVLSANNAGSTAASVIVMILMYLLMYGLILAALVFVLKPLTVGFAKFFMGNRLRRPNYGDIFFGLKKGSYFKLVGAMAWMALFFFLWEIPYLISYGGLIAVILIGLPFYIKLALIIFLSLLFIASIALLVYKGISYSLTAYILSDNPAIGYRRALRLSIGMTKGQVGHIFLLWLSFIGWCLLVPFTCGIGVLFLLPYISATRAELYAQLRDNALRARACSFAELNFAEPPAGFFTAE
jgi:uncharacterized membrane protein